MRKKYYILLLLLFVKSVFAQELTCTNRNLNFIQINSNLSIDSTYLSTENNCKIDIETKNISHIKYISYLSSENILYRFDNKKLKKNKEKILIGVKEPTPVTLFINNDPLSFYQFYLEKGKYELRIDFEKKTALIIGSSLTDEYKEKMRVHDSMYTHYDIFRAMYYMQSKMNRDSAEVLLKMYLPLCDSLSDIHIKNFHETHPDSYITLSDIYSELSYTFGDTNYDTFVNNKKKLQTRFDKLDKNLSKYKLYHYCLELFNREKLKFDTPKLEPLLRIKQEY